jgi:hypothetical protein
MSVLAVGCAVAFPELAAGQAAGLWTAARELGTLRRAAALEAELGAVRSAERAELEAGIQRPEREPRRQAEERRRESRAREQEEVRPSREVVNDFVKEVVKDAVKDELKRRIREWLQKYGSSPAPPSATPPPVASKNGAGLQPPPTSRPQRLATQTVELPTKPTIRARDVNDGMQLTVDAPRMTSPCIAIDIKTEPGRSGFSVFVSQRLVPAIATALTELANVNHAQNPEDLVQALSGVVRAVAKDAGVVLTKLQISVEIG